MAVTAMRRYPRAVGRALVNRLRTLRLSATRSVRHHPAAMDFAAVKHCRTLRVRAASPALCDPGMDQAAMRRRRTLKLPGRLSAVKLNRLP